MDSFKSSDKIVLNEGDSSVGFRFHLTQATTQDGKGFVPYGLDATSVNITIFDSDSTAVIGILEYASISNNVITATLSYPENVVEPGQYTIKFTIGFDNINTTLNAYFSRLYLLAGLD